MTSIYFKELQINLFGVDVNGNKRENIKREKIGLHV